VVKSGARLDAVRRFARWAARGDSLGFITEPADVPTVRRRRGWQSLPDTLPRRRRIAGRFRAQVLLPARTCSDDTQLRLATGRAIHPDGSFDVGALPSVEMVAWRAYALGAGRANLAAAQSPAALTRVDRCAPGARHGAGA